MAHFLIFLPNATGDARANLRTAGLDVLLRDDDFQPESQQGVGPEKLVGQLITWLPATSPASWPKWEFSSERHRALPAPPDPERKLPGRRYWYLDEPGRAVTPTDLQRRPEGDLTGVQADEMAVRPRYAGLSITLGDGQAWWLPNQFQLPHHFAIDECGKFCSTVITPQRPLYDRMLWAFRSCQSQLAQMFCELPSDVLTADDRRFISEHPPRDIEHEEAFKFSCEMLALNYRIDPWMAGVLGLFTPKNFWRVLMGVTDAATINQLIADVQKKTTAITAAG